MKKFLSFLVAVIALTILLIPFNYYVLEELLKLPFGNLQYASFAYFVMVILGIHYKLLGALKKRPQQFVTTFMGLMAIKMFLSIGLMLLMIYAGGADIKSFVVNFVVLYMLYTALEIQYILKAQRAQDDAEKK